MLKMTQCTQAPMGASGSSAIRAKLLVASGTSVHFSGGEWSSSSPVYVLGIVAPWVNAVDVSFMAGNPSVWGVELLHPARNAMIQKQVREGFRMVAHRSL